MKKTVIIVAAALLLGGCVNVKKVTETNDSLCVGNPSVEGCISHAQGAQGVRALEGIETSRAVAEVFAEQRRERKTRRLEIERRKDRLSAQKARADSKSAQEIFLGGSEKPPLPK